MIIYDPENNYEIGTPFTYLIGWTELDIFYYGVRYSKDCHPDDLWSSYFTSSTPVKKFRKLNGEPDLIKVDFVFYTAKEATAYEHQFLKENNCVKDSKWLNLGNGGEDFCNLECSEETRQKMRKPKSEETRQKMSDARRGKKLSEEHCKNISDAQKGKTHSDEAKQKISDARRGKKLSEEHKQKMRKPKSPESIQKRIETCRLKRLEKTSVCL
jgi:tRNA-dihydrouridine synthase